VSKYGDIIKKAREPENQIEVNPDSQTIPIEPEQLVNLCVKVPVKLRRYWMSKAKEQGITVTSVIVEALSQKFGKP